MVKTPRPKKYLSDFWFTQASGFREMYARKETSSTEYLMRLIQVKRAIGNFVRIVTGENIPVKFSTGDESYAAIDRKGKRTVIISATDNPDTFDATVGTALHEAVHLILSNKSRYRESTPLYELLALLQENLDHFVTHDMLNLAQSKRLQIKQTHDLVHTMINFLEDRRCDRWKYQNAVGYRGYYDRFYEESWLHPEIGELLVNEFTHEPRLTNYILHVLNMINENADPSFLPGLDEIWKVANLGNLERFNYDPKWDTYPTMFKERFVPMVTTTGRTTLTSIGHGYPMDELPELVQAAIHMAEIVLTHMEPINKKQDKKKDESEQKKKSETDPDNHDMGSSLGDEEEEIENDSKSGDGDGDDEKDNDGEDGEDEDVEGTVDEVVKKQKKFLYGDIEKEALSNPEDQKLLDALESSNALLKDVNGEFGKVNVVVYQTLTMPLLKMLYPGDSLVPLPEVTQAINRGFVMGGLLAHKLQLSMEETVTRFPRRFEGRLDKRRIAAIGSGDEDVFQSSVVESYPNTEIHLSLDASTSMHGKKWERSMSLAVALAVAASKIRNLRVVISMRATRKVPFVLVAYDSKVDHVVKLRKLFPYLRANGFTPEGICFAALQDLMFERTDRNTKKYFINVSDGMPIYHWSNLLPDGSYETFRYHEEEAIRHTKQQVNVMRGNGINILSYFIGTKEDEKNFKADFQEMYGKSAAFIDPNNVVQIAQTVNKLILSGGI